LRVCLDAMGAASARVRVRARDFLHASLALEKVLSLSLSLSLLVVRVHLSCARVRGVVPYHVLMWIASRRRVACRRVTKSWKMYEPARLKIRRAEADEWATGCATWGKN